jgi:glycosyltransferase involved in cell wall biosynthesis
MKYKSNISVGHFPAQPHCFAYGGFDIQMNRVIDLLNSDYGGNIRINPWQKECKFDIAHFWGAELSHSVAFRFCKERNIPCVVSVLIPNHGLNSIFAMKAKGFARTLIKGKSFFADADIVTVINDQQASLAQYVYGFDPLKIRVIPTIVDEAFFQVNNNSVSDTKSVLCVGTIGPRKNQLNLLRAAKELGVDVVLCGRFDDSNPSYIQQIVHELEINSSRFRHYSDISADKLVDLYLETRVVACVSHQETEPASVLEAMILNRGVVVSNLPFGRNPRFAGAEYCDPLRIDSIKNALMNSIAKPKSEFPNFISFVHRSEAVVNSYQELYLHLLGEI